MGEQLSQVILKQEQESVRIISGENPPEIYVQHEYIIGKDASTYEKKFPSIDELRRYISSEKERLPDLISRTPKEYAINAAKVFIPSLIIAAAGIFIGLEGRVNPFFELGGFMTAFGYTATIFSPLPFIYAASDKLEELESKYASIQKVEKALQKLGNQPTSISQ